MTSNASGILHMPSALLYAVDRRSRWSGTLELYGGAQTTPYANFDTRVRTKRSR